MAVGEIVDSIIEWIREQAKLAGVRGAVFGLSGGLDSAMGDLGVTYRALDSILKDLQAGSTPTEAPALVAGVERLIGVSEHKRAPIPIFNTRSGSAADYEE